MTTPASPTFNTLIDARQLIPLIGSPELRIFDCRYDLGNPQYGADAYMDGHLPGACYLNLDQDLSGSRSGQNGRHPLPARTALIERLGQLDVTANTQIVAYDDAFGMFAARLWWLMRWLGHEKVAVLNGGLSAWTEAGQCLTTEKPEFSASKYLAAEPLVTSVDANYIEQHLKHSDMRIIDARSPDRFRGENETLDAVGGHIPGAHNHFFRENLGEHGCFKPADMLRQVFTRLMQGHPSGQIIHQCGSGVTACHNVLAMEYAGLPGSRLYPGSWSEWSSNPDRPVAKGVSSAVY